MSKRDRLLQTSPDETLAFGHFRWILRRDAPDSSHTRRAIIRVENLADERRFGKTFPVQIIHLKNSTAYPVADPYSLPPDSNDILSHRRVEQRLLMRLAHCRFKHLANS